MKSEVKPEATSLASLKQAKGRRKNTAALKRLSIRIRIFLKIAPVWQNGKTLHNG
jgi:hypothetical protein